MNRFYWALILLVTLCILAFFFELASGPVSIQTSEIFTWLMGNGSAQTHIILNELRLPRALLALAVGVALAVSGCASQSLFRNPLADPSLIGVSAGASAGASLVIVIFANYHGQYFGLSLVSIGAFCGGLVVVWLVFNLASARYGTSVVTMLLAGVALSYLAGSLSQFLEFIADEHMLKRISFWRMGGLDGADTWRASLMIITSCAVTVFIWRLRTALNVLLLGESQARHLGFDIKRLRWQIILCIALAVGVSVAMAGAITFVGLIVPHVARLWVGPDHRKLIPVSALMGATLIVTADIFARNVIAPAEVPVGLFISVLGAPIFIILLRQRLTHSLVG